MIWKTMCAKLMRRSARDIRTVRYAIGLYVITYDLDNLYDMNSGVAKAYPHRRASGVQHAPGLMRRGSTGEEYRQGFLDPS